MRSPADAIALVLSRHLGEEGVAEVKPEQAVRAERMVQPGLFPSTNVPSTNGDGPHVPSGARCPKCSGYLIHQEGCLRCLDCGYTKCE